MNSLRQVAFRFVNIASSISPNTFKNALVKREFARSLWCATKKPEVTSIENVLSPNHSLNCGCGCGMKHMHTKGERELVEFLTEEIVSERKIQKTKVVPAAVDGFSVKVDGSEVELTKQSDKEKIVISFNVNHTVDTEDEPEIDQNADKPNMGEMRSKPQFEVDIVKGNTTLSFTCSFLQGTPQEGEYNDIYGIDEMCIYENEWNDKVYAVAGDVLDGYLYDLLMNLLEEKGVSNEFAEKLSDLATTHEHSSYIGLLEKLSKFTTGAAK